MRSKWTQLCCYTLSGDYNNPRSEPILSFPTTQTSLAVLKLSQASIYIAIGAIT